MYHVGDLTIGELVGKGAHGSVYRADLNGTTMAVKIASEQTERYKQQHIIPEIDLLHGVSHPNLVRIHGAQTIDRQSLQFLTAHCNDWQSSLESELFSTSSSTLEANCEAKQDDSGFQTVIVMEFCDRGSLWDGITRGEFMLDKAHGLPNYPLIIEVALEIAFGMQHLHGADIVHGDLKAKNIMLVSASTARKKFIAKVGDFEMCRRLLNSRYEIVTLSVGTVDHMPPELLREGKLHCATDVYSFGVTIWELISGGMHPFQRLSTPAIVMAIVEGMRPNIPSSCPGPLAALVRSCWHHDPGKRPTFNRLVGQLIQLLLSCSSP